GDDEDHGNGPKDKDKKDKKDEHPVPTSGAEMRFRGLDLNNNGVITRAEWRGSNSSFANQDWNHDGVLSGDEVRPGATRPFNRAAPPAPNAGRDPDEAEFARL